MDSLPPPDIRDRRSGESDTAYAQRIAWLDQQEAILSRLTAQTIALESDDGKIEQRTYPTREVCQLAHDHANGGCELVRTTKIEQSVEDDSALAERIERGKNALYGSYAETHLRNGVDVPIEMPDSERLAAVEQ